MERQVRNIPEMYSEMMILMKMQGKEEPSRNGPVLTLQEPLTITVNNPTDRLLFDPIRCANPFFHAMEFVWMMAGENEVEWIQQFNSRFDGYADEDGIVHGAYGHRWRYHFGIDQIEVAIDMLSENPESRRVVLAMWDGSEDLGTEHNDLPCNTHIYVRIVGGALNFTVVNRSNDVVWGMAGANAVHMTMLQELMAAALKVPVGKYTVFTNNAHVYTDLPLVQQMLNTTYPTNPLPRSVKPTPLLAEGEKIDEFLDDCATLIAGDHGFNTHWMGSVAFHMYTAYLARKRGEVGYAARCMSRIRCPHWKHACQLWVALKTKEVYT